MMMALTKIIAWIVLWQGISFGLYRLWAARCVKEQESAQDKGWFWFKFHMISKAATGGKPSPDELPYVVLNVASFLVCMAILVFVLF